MPGDAPTEQYPIKSLCTEVPGDAEGISAVGFLDPVVDAFVFGQIAEGQTHRLVLMFSSEFVVHFPSNDRHERSVTERLTASFNFQFNLSSVISLVTRFAQRNEIVRAVTAGLAAFKVMDVQDLILAFAMAVLALVVIAEQDVFAYVPETELWSLLVLLPGYAGVFKQLRVELCHFHDDGLNGKDAADRLHYAEMGFDFLSDGRRQPAFFLG